MALQRKLEAMTNSAVTVSSVILSRITTENYRTVFTQDGRVLTSVLIGSRYRAKAMTEAAMTATITSRIGAVVPPVSIPYDAVKFTRSGLDTGALLARTPGVIDSRIAAGLDPETAVQQGVSLARSLISSEAFRVNRATVEEATATDPRFSGWMRVAEADACDFCAMLVTRGAVYTSRDTAEGALDYHNNCRCYAEEVVDATVARAIARDGQAAWEAQVAAGRAPAIRRRASGSSASESIRGAADLDPNLAGLPREQALEILARRVSFYEEMAQERSNIPGRHNYAESNAEKARRQRERLLRTP